MQELAEDALEHDVVAWVAWDARFGWVVLADSPFHDEPVILRTPDDLLVLLTEMFCREGEEREPEEFFVDAP